MQKITISSDFFVFDSLTYLPKEIHNLMQEAIAIRKKAYAPYSNFKVGAALLLDNGKIVLGSNQENAAYPSGLCAERVAIFQAGTLYPKAQIISIAVSAASDRTPTTKPIPPCGACRQSIAEYEIKQTQNIAIYFMGESGPIYQSESLQNLLPFLFDKNFL